MCVDSVEVIFNSIRQLLFSFFSICCRVFYFCMLYFLLDFFLPRFPSPFSYIFLNEKKRFLYLSVHIIWQNHRCHVYVVVGINYNIYSLLDYHDCFSVTVSMTVINESITTKTSNKHSVYAILSSYFFSIFLAMHIL